MSTSRCMPNFTASSMYFQSELEHQREGDQSYPTRAARIRVRLLDTYRNHERIIGKNKE